MNGRAVTVWGIGLLSSVLLVGAWWSTAQVKGPELESQLSAYERERRELEQGGLSRFAIDWIQQADQLVSQAKSFWQAGRVSEAARAIFRARWILPAVPPDLPSAVERIYGSVKLRHGPSITAVAWSADGRYFATAGTDSGVRIWDAANGRELRIIPFSEQPTALAFANKSPLLAIGGHSHVVRLWDIAAGKEALPEGLTLPNPGGKKWAVLAVAFDPEDRYLAASTSQQRVLVWKLAEKRLDHELSGYNGQPSSLSFSSDGEYLAAGASDGLLRVYKMQQGALWRAFRANGGAIYAVAFVPGQKQAVVAGQDNFVRIFDVDRSQEVVRWKSGAHGSTAVAVSKNGKLVAVGCATPDPVIRIWRLPQQDLLLTFRGHQQTVQGLAFDPTGQLLVSGSMDGQFRLWDVGSLPAHRELLGHEGAVWSVAVHLDGQRIASGGADGTVRIWDVGVLDQARLPAGGRSGPVSTWKLHQLPVTTVAFSPDGNLLASAGGDHLIRLVDAQTGREIRRLQGHSAAVTCLAFDPQGKWLASGGADRQLILWDLATGKPRRTVNRYGSIVTGVAFVQVRDTQGQASLRLISCGSDQQIRAWDVPELNNFQVWSGHRQPITALAVSPRGDSLASADGDGRILLWQTSAGRERLVLTGHTGPVSALAFSPNGKLLASGGADQSVRVWDSVTGQEVRQFKGHTDWIAGLAFFPDNQRLVSCGVDQTLKIWELSGQELIVGYGHTGKVTALAAPSSDSAPARWFISGSQDTTLRLWDTATARELALLAEHADEITALACDRSGQRIASADRNGTIKTWEMTDQKKIAPPRLRNTFSAGRASVILLAWTPDGTQLVGWVIDNKSDKTLTVWDAASGKVIRTFASHDRGVRVRCLCFSSDARYAAVGGQNGVVRIWDLSTGALVKTVTPFTTAVGDLAFTHDDRLLVLADAQGQVQVRDWQADRVIRSWPTQQASLAVIAISPDNRHLVSCDIRGEIRLWHLESGTLQASFKLPVLVQTVAFLGANRLLTANANGTVYQLAWPEKR